MGGDNGERRKRWGEVEKGLEKRSKEGRVLEIKKEKGKDRTRGIGWSGGLRLEGKGERKRGEWGGTASKGRRGESRGRKENRGISRGRREGLEQEGATRGEKRVQRWVGAGGVGRRAKRTGKKGTGHKERREGGVR